MGMKTGIISYNLNDRGRKLIGQKRNFNVQAVVKIINGEKLQEQVKAGDLVGYLGHGIRQEFGLNPPETALADNKLIPIDPAFVTTYIKAYDDGTIEHEAKFLDTALGRTAEEWFKAKTGGFSSVFYPDEKNPISFFGFDYVRAPNFNGNRGYTMDSAQFDFELNRLTSKQKFEVLRAEQEEMRAVMDAVLQSGISHAERSTWLDTLNRQLTATVDCLGKQLEETTAALDEARETIKELEPKHAPMMRLSVSRTDNWLTDAVASFDDANGGKKRVVIPDDIPIYQEYCG